MEEKKRETADFIPYKIIDGKIFVFLQKRDKNAKVIPNYFSFFGGKIDPGETPEQALLREVKEELSFIPQDYSFLGKYQSSINENFFLYIYFAKVDDDFESKITVSEGEYGKFISEAEVMSEPLLIDSDKKILKDLYINLKNGK